MSTEILLVTNKPELVDALRSYALEPFSAPSLTRVRSLLTSDQPPPVVYIEDSRAVGSELWDVVHLAQERGVRVLVGLQTIGAGQLTDFTDAGIAATTVREPAEVARWIGSMLNIARRAAATHVVIAVGGAKGGIGKSLVVAILAEALCRRGLRVLVVDGDLSNSGIVPTFRIPTGFRSFLALKEEGRGYAHYTPQKVADLINHHPTGIDFLLGSDEGASDLDFIENDWKALMSAVDRLGEVLEQPYDVVLVDTGPDIRKRRYALGVAHAGGWVVLPTSPGRKERTGAGILLRQLGAYEPDVTDRALLLFMEPEKGVVVNTTAIAPLFAQHWPRVRSIGTLPRDPRLVSMADEEADRYVSPLDVSPSGRFAVAAHTVVDNLCQITGLRPPLPKPAASPWQRLISGFRKPSLPAAASVVASAEPAVPVAAPEHVRR